MENCMSSFCGFLRHMSRTGRYTRKSLSGCPFCRKLWQRSTYFMKKGASRQMLFVGDMSMEA